MNRFYVRQNSWLPRIAERCREAGVVGLDIETAALPAWKNDSEAGLDPFKSRIRLIQLATEELSWIIDLNHVTDVQPVLDLFSSDTTFVIHSAQFETKNFLHHFGVFPDRIFDTLLASKMLQPVYDFMWKNGLGAVVQRFLFQEMDKDEQTSDWSVAELSESQIEYAFRDAEVLLPLYHVLSGKLHENGMMWGAQAEFGCVLAIAEMELTGLVLDCDVLGQLRSIIGGRLQNLRKYLATELPTRQYGLFDQEPINLNSPNQLLDAFERRTGVRLTKEERGDKWGEFFEKESTDKTALLRQRKNHQKLVDALLDYGSLIHMLDNYCSVDEHVHPVTGRIHPEYRQIGQWQGRAATKNPNLNFPRPNSFGPGVSTPALIENFHAEVSFRQLFKAPEGRLFSIADFATNQLRIISDEPFANERTLIEEFNRENANPYKRIASIGLNKPFEAVTGAERFAYKTLTLALMFGAGVRRFQQTRLEETRLEMSEYEAQQEINSFFRAVPNISEWHSSVLPDLQRRGFVASTMGRKIFFPDNRMTKNRASNFPICATEKDGAALAGGRLSRELRRRGLDAKPVMFVYDEFVLDTAKSCAKEVLELQCEIMRDSMQQVLKTVPAVVEGALGTSWGDKK